MKLIQISLENAPDNVQIRESRGQILIKMENWNAARIDYEFVLPVYAQNPAFKNELPKVHEALALIYENLGKKTLAQKHASLVKREFPKR